jgi:hypothetical protein
VAERRSLDGSLDLGRTFSPGAVLVHADRFDRTHTLCSRLLDAGLEVTFVAETARLVEAAPDRRFRTVVAFLPMPRPALQQLLEPLRDATGRRGRQALILLVGRSMLPRAEELRSRGVSLVLPDSTPPEVVADLVTQLLRRAPRAAMSVAARLEGPARDGANVSWGRTANLSTSGVLLRTSAAYPLGSTMGVELQVGLPGCPLVGTVRLERLAQPSVDGFAGVAGRFLSFENDGRDRLEALVRSGL